MSTRQEVGVIAKHAQVIFVGQLATMAYGVTDAIVAGRYSDQALATLAVASSIFISIYVSLMTVLQALMPIYAELWGAKKPLEMSATFRQSCYLAAFLVALGMLLMWSGDWLLACFEVPANLRPEAVQYLNILAGSLIPSLMFRMFASLSQSMGLPRVVMWLQISSLLLKIPLTVWFVFGGYGLPAMGVVGCAWASFLVNTACCLGALASLKWSPHYTCLELFARWEQPDITRLKSFAKLGVPAGLASMVEVTSYTLMGLLVARMGVLATAAHQIAASVAAVLFMLPLSLSIASISRVSYWLGAGQPTLAHRVARAAVWLTLGVALCASFVNLLLASQIARAYSSSPEVARMGAALLAFVALYHFMDAWQTIGCFLLRCWRITVMPMAVYALTLWALGLGGGFVLAYRGFAGIEALQHPSAFWLMGALAMGLAALVFMRRIWQLTQVTSLAQPGV